VLPQDGNGKYGDIAIEIKLGTVPQTAAGRLTSDPLINAVWTPAHQGNGIAHAAMVCAGIGDPPTFTKHYPHGLPVLSVVADCTPVWDPRDGAQSSTDPSTWTVSKNPVLQLIDYLTRADGGMGLDYATVIAPNLTAWMVEANLCDELVDTATPGVQEPRYQSNGWFQFDNAPSDVIGSMLATCDGWLAEAGDGADDHRRRLSRAVRPAADRKAYLRVRAELWPERRAADQPARHQLHRSGAEIRVGPDRAVARRGLDRGGRHRSGRTRSS
jgi:hypothetical protein